MKTLLIALAVLLLAVVAAHLLSSDPGFVVVGYRGQLVRTSVNLFAVLLFIAVLLLYASLRLIARVWMLPTHYFQWSHAQRAGKAQQALLSGLTALAEGDWRRAEDTLRRHAAGSDTPLLHYLGAAQAAELQHAHERREAYLREAGERVPEAALAVGLAKAELLLDERKYEDARSLLGRLRALKGKSGHAKVLLLFLRLHMARGEWVEVLNLVPALRQGKALPEAELLERQIDAFAGLMRGAGSLEALETVWSQVPPALRKRADLIEAYAACLQQRGNAVKALPLIQKTLKSEWHGSLVRRFGLIETADPAAQISEAEKWLALNGDDPDLLLTLGRLCFRHGLWGKACYYLEASIARRPSTEAYWLLAETLDHIGDPARAADSRRKGLALAAQLDAAQRRA
ncbi:MAG: heme biosynthesis HemY N-terminal domain-containing protein [Gammaproteobacteria bacterium]